MIAYPAYPAPPANSPAEKTVRPAEEARNVEVADNALTRAVVITVLPPITAAIPVSV